MTASTDTAIIIAAFNAESTLGKAVESGLAQPEAVEVCVVDDGSSDRTLETARALSEADRRVRVISLPQNRGPSAARNAAIEATAAPWLCILDADDFMLPGRLKTLHAHTAAADLVADALLRVSPGETPRPPALEFAPAPMSFERFIKGNLGALKGPLDLGFLKPIVRREFLTQHGIRYREELRLGEDYLFYAESLARGARFLVGAAAGYVSVERPGSLSKEHSEDDLLRMRDCDDYLRTVRPYSAAELKALQRHWTSVDCRLQWRRLISAVKARDLSQALSAFHTVDSALYLVARLSEQAWLRSIGRGPDVS